MWFRSDLRVADHPALAEAATSARREDAELHAVFVVSPGQWDLHDWGSNKRDFVLRAVQSLARSLAGLNIRLHLIQANLFEEVPDKMLALAAEYHIRKIWWHREVGWDERQRDLRVRKLASQQRVETCVLDDRFLVAPEQPLTGAGSPFKVFTPYKKRWLEHLSAASLSAIPAPAPMPGKRPGVANPSSLAFGLKDDRRDLSALWPATEAEAARRLSAFVAQGLADYGQARDFPSQTGTSGLSPYLSAGLISARQCAHAWLIASEGDWHCPAHQVWLSELAWRDFYQYIMWHFPRVSRNQPFVEKTRQLSWRQADEDFLAWCQGKTGIPLVDAAMRQLHATGWMHNRLRMVVAMFLTKNLLVDWRRGEAYFMQQLVDGDFAANNGGWQWSASTGTDAAPYFRVFNPVSQSQRFDPKGHFIRQWLPELAHLDDKQIHLPKPALRGDYPAPIVDLKLSRQQAIDVFAAL